MVVWTTVLSEMVMTGHDPTHTIVTGHLLVFWAVSITLGGALISVRFEKWEVELAGELKKADAAWNAAKRDEIADKHAAKKIQKNWRIQPRTKKAGTAAAAVQSPPPSPPGDTGSLLPPSPLPPPPAQLLDVERDPPGSELNPIEWEVTKLGVTSLARIHKMSSVGTSVRIKRLQASIEFSNLIQGTLGWVAGCAWTDISTIIFPSMNVRSPSLISFASNVGVALFYTTLAMVWIIFTGEDPSTTPWNEVLNREDVSERLELRPHLSRR